jgi:apolipoprotein N-acyltransferase
MGFDSRVRDVAIGLAACAATAALVFFGNGLVPRWPLMWLAPLPVLLFALRRPAWQAGLVAVCAWLAGCLNMWSYFRSLGLPPVEWFTGFGLAAAAFAAGVLLMRALARCDAVLRAWMALPAVYITFEFARNLWLWPHGSAACIAYSQLNFMPFLQFASIAGPWGMGFVLLLFPAGLALAIHLWCSARRPAMLVMGTAVGVITAVLIFGAVRLGIPQPGPRVKVGLVAADAEGNLVVAHPGAATEQRFEQYGQQAHELIAQGAQVVVLPEGLGVVRDPDMPKADAIFQRIVEHSGAVLVVGMVHVAGAVQYDEARIYAPGVAVRSYDKEHLLPPFENIFTSGNTRVLWEAPGRSTGAPWGVAICKDMDFTKPARLYGLAGVGLMLVPGGDFRVDGFWHGHIAVMRAVEDGFSLVRSARRGLLTVADNRGRIVAETSSNSAPFTTLLATVPTGHSGTLFLLLGDWFGWVTMALLVLVATQYVRTFISISSPLPPVLDKTDQNAH